MSRGTVFTGLIVLLVGCGGDSGAPDLGVVEVAHPIPDSLASAKPGIALNVVDDKTPGAGWRVEVPRWTEAATGVDLGFGALVDASVNYDGEVAILDASFGVVRLGPPDSAVLLGGLGGGPGEFVEPVALTHVGADTLIVADRAMRLHVFVRRNGGFEFSRQIDLAFVPNDVCANSGRLIVQGPPISRGESGPPEIMAGQNGAVHEVSWSGVISSSVSIPYASTNRVIRQIYDLGSLTCDDEFVWVGYETLGEVHALRDDGELRWVTRLDDVQYPGLVTAGNGVRPELTDMDRIETIQGVSLPSPGVLAVSVESRIVATSDVTRRTYWLDSWTGTFLGRSDGYGVLGGGDGVAVLYREDPTPEVALVTMGYLP